MTDGRQWESGPGFLRARECPDCGHTRCGEDCVCNCEAARAEAEAAALRAELEAAETLRASANAEIARLAAQVDALRTEHACMRSAFQDEIEDGPRDPMCGVGLAKELETARAELVEARKDVFAAVSVYNQGKREARAVAIEEAARKFGQYMEEGWRVATALTAIRALAPLDPALCVVATEAKQAAIDAIKRLLAQVEGRTTDDSIKRTTPVEDGIIALSMLGDDS